MNDLQKINKTQLIKGMHELSLNQMEVYNLETDIRPFRIERYKMQGDIKTKTVDLSVPAGHLSLPVAYARVKLDVYETIMWSYFVDKFARGEKVPGEWNENILAGFHTDWNAYLRGAGKPVSLDFELLRVPVNFDASLVNNHNVYEESFGTSTNGIATSLNTMICDYFIMRDKFEKDEIMKTYSGFDANAKNRYFSIDDKQRKQVVLEELKAFHDEVKRNVMDYFTPKTM